MGATCSSRWRGDAIRGCREPLGEEMAEQVRGLIVEVAECRESWRQRSAGPILTRLVPQL